MGALADIGQAGINNTGAIASGIPELSKAQNDANNLAQIGAQRWTTSRALSMRPNQNPWTKAANLRKLPRPSAHWEATSEHRRGPKVLSHGSQIAARHPLAASASLANDRQAGRLSALFSLSDVDAKENIHEVGTTRRRAADLLYRLQDGGPTQMGLMAQNVMQQAP